MKDLLFVSPLIKREVFSLCGDESPDLCWIDCPLQIASLISALETRRRYLVAFGCDELIDGIWPRHSQAILPLIHDRRELLLGDSELYRALLESYGGALRLLLPGEGLPSLQKGITLGAITSPLYPDRREQLEAHAAASDCQLLILEEDLSLLSALINGEEHPQLLSLCNKKAFPSFDRRIFVVK